MEDALCAMTAVQMSSCAVCLETRSLTEVRGGVEPPTVPLENPERSEPTRIILLSEFSPSMLTSLLALLITLRSILGSRLDLQLEILALRHQIAVLQRSAKKRPRLTATDRLLWVSLSRIWPLALDVGCLSSPKRLWPGIAKASACFGLGRYGTDDPDGRRSRARFGT